MSSGQLSLHRDVGSFERMQRITEQGTTKRSKLKSCVVRIIYVANWLLFGIPGLLVGTRSLGQEKTDFVRDIRPIFEKHCYGCHGESKQESGLRLDIKSEALRGGDHRGPDLVPGKLAESPLFQLISSTDAAERMPPESRLSNEQIESIRRWILEGCVWPDGIDKRTLKNTGDRWSFKPLNQNAPFQSIDEFIDAKLEERGLNRLQAASPQTWLRRVTIDLTGLPPSPQEVDEFHSPSETDFEHAVDRLLANPRYGERWGQHWLDVVRYADTHGFEVNTERPNAWPYRDYVIRAFNADKAYDQFVREQIIGDQLGEDAATGFLITASVLLPGQIGKDAASIRLARQDAIDEIVNNIGQTFLGLSIGCARCHDHKFDPITAKDYYAMQAFIAGVEYEDREWNTPEGEEKKQHARELNLRRQSVLDSLAAYQPIARPQSSFRTTSSRENIEAFEPVAAKFVRFSIHDANEHPQLGLIEPCVDEFEIYSSAGSENLALAVRGTKVSASGSNVSESHKLEFVHDGTYGNSKSWMSNAKGSGWLLFELPESAKINKIVWGRDRLGKFQDRLATAYTLEASLDNKNWITLSEVPMLRPTVGAGKVNVDRFQIISTKRLRFSIRSTNSLEPCLDELEVFNTRGKNVSLASNGTRVKTSGDIIVESRHHPSFIHDGKYGNESSWLGNETGKGWIELEFLQSEEVARVVWSRDRLGSLEDRLPIDYTIEAEVNGQFCVVADSTDRRPHVAGMSRGSEFSLTGLESAERDAAQSLLNKKLQLDRQIKELEQGQSVFGGKFRKPDPIFKLRRGDPEQPGELTAPAIPEFLGDLTLSPDSTESDRRRSLAEWIVSTQNPLTSRVVVNRVWQGHFGIGLIDTPSDLGNSGSKPTHPELLDWLASDFMRNRWSLKRLHKQIVLSKTYRTSSQFFQTDQNAKRAKQIDSESRLLWRFPSRRVEAETIRDSMLEVSGLANRQMYGRGFDLFNQRGGLSGFTPIEQFKSANTRRAIYAHKVRREKDSVFGVFDCPDAGQSTARRRESMTPIQALNLFNSRMTMELADAFAKRLQREREGDLTGQIVFAFELTLARRPNDEELEEIQHLVQQFGLPVLCRALFNSNEFLSLP